MARTKQKIVAKALPNLRSDEVDRIYIEEVYPTLQGGRFGVKRIAGEVVEVWADIFRDGHDLLEAQILWQRDGDPDLHTAPMTLQSNDRWMGQFTPSEPGRYTFFIEAWTDSFGSWRRDVNVRLDAGQKVTSELEEGRQLLRKAKVKPTPRRSSEVSHESDLDDLLGEETAVIMADTQPHFDRVVSKKYPLIVDRPEARCAAWYEMVPRSQGCEPGRSATFDDCIARLPEIAELGFDVVYLPPIHPIGRTNRKGRNNSLAAAAGDPGSMYAIGADEGGHDAVHPELGGLPAFRRFVSACKDNGLEVALDFAVQCSPDHPWVKEYPQWFRRRPDGTIRYAENPPKKYEDIVNVDFYCDDWANLWMALREVVRFWVREGVKIFRVDNPHTKPFPFWEWMIREIQREDPEVLFLSEAFTRPKVMKALAKLGFSQSYTYFTWRNTKAELSEYISELIDYPAREFFRPNFFVTTPDILPVNLQGGEPWLFKARFGLAATLSGVYGIYNGFELLEHEALPGREEYLDSEKYEYKVRDWNKPGNIKDYIARLNRIRRQNPALQQTNNLKLLPVDHDGTIGFIKEAVDGRNAVAVAIAVTGGEPREFWLHFGGIEIGPPGDRRHVKSLENLATGHRFDLSWDGVRLRIDPNQDPVLMFRCFP
jgi:starch synthase (maltosyl-transferring)